jgi:hypothetical protein
MMQDTEEISVQRPLAMRAPGIGYIHSERSDQCDWYERQEHWPFVGGAQYEKDDRNRQTEGRHFQENALSSLDDPKNIQFQVSRHHSRGLVAILSF